jgi:hypothetical protein
MGHVSNRVPHRGKGRTGAAVVAIAAMALTVVPIIVVLGDAGVHGSSMPKPEIALRRSCQSRETFPPTALQRFSKPLCGFLGHARPVRRSRRSEAHAPRVSRVRCQNHAAGEDPRADRCARHLRRPIRAPDRLADRGGGLRHVDEYQAAYANWKKHGRPGIVFYFQRLYGLPKSQQFDDLRRVVAFKEELDRDVLAWEYGRPAAGNAPSCQSTYSSGTSNTSLSLSSSTTRHTTSR